MEDVLQSVLLATLRASPNASLRAAYHTVLDALDDGEKDLTFALIQDHGARRPRGGRRRRGPPHHLPPAALRGQPILERAQGHGPPARRYGRDLHADGPRARDGGPRLRPPGHRPLRRVRRLLGRIHPRPRQRCEVEVSTVLLGKQKPT